MTITSLWVFCVIDPVKAKTWNECVVGICAPDGTTTPLVTADPAQVASYRVIAQSIATDNGLTIELKRFSEMTIEEVIEPGMGDGVRH